MDIADSWVSCLQPHTPLELEIAQLLHGSQNVMTKERMLTPAEEKALRAMSLEEVCPSEPGGGMQGVHPPAFPSF